MCNVTLFTNSPSSWVTRAPFERSSVFLAFSKCSWAEFWAAWKLCWADWKGSRPLSYTHRNLHCNNEIQKLCIKSLLKSLPMKEELWSTKTFLIHVSLHFAFRKVFFCSLNCFNQQRKQEKVVKAEFPKDPNYRKREQWKKISEFLESFGHSCA